MALIRPIAKPANIDILDVTEVTDYATSLETDTISNAVIGDYYLYVASGASTGASATVSGGTIVYTESSACLVLIKATSTNVSITRTTTAAWLGTTRIHIKG